MRKPREMPQLTCEISEKNVNKQMLFVEFSEKKNVDFLEEYRHFTPPPNRSTRRRNVKIVANIYF